MAKLIILFVLTVVFTSVLSAKVPNKYRGGSTIKNVAVYPGKVATITSSSMCTHIIMTSVDIFSATLFMNGEDTGKICSEILSCEFEKSGWKAGNDYVVKLTTEKSSGKGYIIVDYHYGGDTACWPMVTYGLITAFGFTGLVFLVPCLICCVLFCHKTLCINKLKYSDDEETNYNL